MLSGKKNLVKNFEMFLSVNFFEKLNKNIKIKRRLQIFMPGRSILKRKKDAHALRWMIKHFPYM